MELQDILGWEAPMRIIASRLVWVLGSSRALVLLPDAQAVLDEAFLHPLSLQSPIFWWVKAGGHIWAAPKKLWYTLLLSPLQGRRS